QLDGPAAVVLRELVLVELRKSCGQPLLHLARQRHAPVLPIDGDELAQLVGKLDDALKRVGNQTAMGLVTGHLAHQEQRCVTKLHLLARLDRERSNALGLDLGNEFRDAAGDLDAVLVELALPKQAGQHRTAQLQLVRDVTGRGALVMASSARKIENVHTSHVAPQSSVVSLHSSAKTC